MESVKNINSSKNLTVKKKKFVYLCSISYDGTVYKTQVIDWLKLYDLNGITFDLLQIFHFRLHYNPFLMIKQIKTIRKETHLLKGFLYFFPSKNFLYIINTLVLYALFLKYIFRYDNILVLSRGMYGREMNLLKKIFPRKITFYYDARAASAEENKYLSNKRNDFSRKRADIIKYIIDLENRTLQSADKIFVVSEKLKNYFIKNYNTPKYKFFLYPCLSDSNKFYYDKKLRANTRKDLNYTEQDIVYVYAGGLSSSWHVTDFIFNFFNYASQKQGNAKFLILSRDTVSISKMLENNPDLKNKVIFMSVDNEIIGKYYNASDYGILFRENSIMNNVASPTKFAEYLLCGLPVLISEGVGDYSDFCKTNGLGFVINEDQLKDNSLLDPGIFQSNEFNRDHISAIGKKFLTKESILPKVLELFNTDVASV
ncbi:MAG: hypothetical protein P4L27_09025 [Ignavibacteriaceae bacterium]|nr:hypothetical protein [Ignavibacteriaceae bacterium]